MIRRLGFALMLLCGGVPAPADTGWALVRSYPHDAGAFTQGLLWHDGLLYESTGIVGRSDIRVVRLEDGRVLRRVKVPAPYFGEGITLWRDRLVSLTWQHGKGFVWSLPDLGKSGDFAYRGEGWGMTSDGRHLIMSDGTAELRFLDAATLEETGRLPVTWNGEPVPMLNELEYVDGEILANIWMSTRIARIDPASGKVIDWIELAELAARAGVKGQDDVLNGIAWDAEGRRLFVTGKNWPRLFEIRLER